MTSNMHESASAGAALDGSNLVFVCGAPRTGVRLLGALLDAHPQAASGPELPFVVTMARQWRDIESTLGENHEKHYGVAKESTRRSFVKAISQLVAGRLSATGKPKFAFASFAAALSIDVLAALFPAAKFVLMLRDPRDVVCSLLRCDWRNPRDGLALPYTRDVQAGARFWLEFTQLALRVAGTDAVRGRLIGLRYEDLCANSKDTMEKLAQFLELTPAQPSVLPQSAALIIHGTDQPHPPLRNGPLDTASIGQWRRRLRAEDIARVDRITAPVRAQLGYT